MSLRDKVLALVSTGWDDEDLLAIAVARLVAEHCAGVCEKDGQTTISPALRAQCDVLAFAIRKEANWLKP